MNEPLCVYSSLTSPRSLIMSAKGFTGLGIGLGRGVGCCLGRRSISGSTGSIVVSLSFGVGFTVVGVIGVSYILVENVAQGAG